MSDIFPKWTNRLPLQIAVGALFVGTAVTAGVWYYFTPKYTRVGYQPIQPVAFSHAIHADQLGLDCRRCDGKIAAVDVVNDDRQTQQHQSRYEGALHFGVVSRGKIGRHCAGLSALSHSNGKPIRVFDAVRLAC